MLTKSFKSNKYYEVTRFYFKYGNEWDEMENTITVWDTYEKAMAYIERYATGLKFASARIEVINLDREITAEDYKKGDYNIVSFQKIYDVTLEGVEDFTKGKICYFEKSEQAGETAVEEKSEPVNEEVYKIYFGNDRTFGIQTVGLQSALELGQAYAKYHAGEKITVIDEDKNIIQEFFEEKKEPVKSNIKAKTNLKSRYLTKKEWDNSHKYFTSWANIGDVVDEETVQHFRDCVSPIAYDAMYLQCGEPYTHEFNPKTRKWEPAFITFARELGSWVYKGICFYREYEDVG